MHPVRKVARQKTVGRVRLARMVEIGLEEWRKGATGARVDGQVPPVSRGTAETAEGSQCMSSAPYRFCPNPYSSVAEEVLAPPRRLGDLAQAAKRAMVADIGRFVCTSAVRTKAKSAFLSCPAARREARRRRDLSWSPRSIY